MKIIYRNINDLLAKVKEEDSNLYEALLRINRGLIDFNTILDAELSGEGFDNLAPTTTLGDMIYHDGATNVRLPIGALNEVLTVGVGNIPEWQAAGSGGAPTNATYITQTPHASLLNEQALSTLATGILKNQNGTGVLTIATLADFPATLKGWTDDGGVVRLTTVSDQVGIGTSSPVAGRTLDIIGRVGIGGTIANTAALDSFITFTPIFNGSGDIPFGIVFNPTFIPSINISDARGFHSIPAFSPPVGVTITNAYSTLLGFNEGGAGTIINSHTLFIGTPTGTPTTHHGLHIANQGVAGITTAYGIRVEPQSGATNNYAAIFGGVVGIDTTTPLAKLSLNGGLHVGGDSDPGDNNTFIDGKERINTLEPTTTDNVGGIIAPTRLYMVEGTSGSPVSGNSYKTPIAHFERWDDSSGVTNGPWSNPAMTPIVLIEGRLKGIGASALTGIASRIQSNSNSNLEIQGGAFLAETHSPAGSANKQCWGINSIVSWQDAGLSPGNLIGIECDIINSGADSLTDLSDNFTAFWAQAAASKMATMGVRITSIGDVNSGWRWGIYADVNMTEWAAYFKNNYSGGGGIFVGLLNGVLSGTVLSKGLVIGAGALGTTVNSEIEVANFGFKTINSVSLSVRGYRTAAGSDWTTSAINLGMDVDNTKRAGANMWFHANGNIGFGTNALLPTAPVDIFGDTIRLRTTRTPASATAAGNTGDVCWDATHIYVCINTNTWRRIAHATW